MDSLNTVSALPPELQTEILHFLLALADTKRALGLRYAEWCDRAPRLEAGVAASAMAQDELGQARVLYALLSQFPGAPADLDDETRPHSFGLAYLDRSFPNWATFVAANLLAGAGITITEQALVASRFTPLRSRMAKMLDEERYHRIHAAGWFKQLQGASETLRQELAGAVRDLTPHVLCWFGDAQHQQLLEQGLITAGPGDLRERWLEAVGPAVQSTDAANLLRFHPQANCWSYTDPLPWPLFDPITRRLQRDG